MGRFLGEAKHRRLPSRRRSCSYKTEPNSLREVEIAYYTFPHREGGGIATAMARELTARALPHVALVIAHTLPVENASARCCGAAALSRWVR